MKNLKLYFSAVLIITTMCFLTAGCGRRETNHQGLSKKTQTSTVIDESSPDTTEISAANSNSNVTSGGSTGSANSPKNSAKNSSSSSTSKSSEAATSQKLQQLSEEMDKLGSSLKELDNSADITTTESVINNFN